MTTLTFLIIESVEAQEAAEAGRLGYNADSIVENLQEEIETFLFVEKYGPNWMDPDPKEVSSSLPEWEEQFSDETNVSFAEVWDEYFTSSEWDNPITP